MRAEEDKSNVARVGRNLSLARAPASQRQQRKLHERDS
jgi:hypothetical protein